MIDFHATCIVAPLIRHIWQIPIFCTMKLQLSIVPNWHFFVNWYTREKLKLKKIQKTKIKLCLELYRFTIGGGGYIMARWKRRNGEGGQFVVDISGWKPFNWQKGDLQVLVRQGGRLEEDHCCLIPVFNSLNAWTFSGFRSTIFSGVVRKFWRMLSW